MRGFFKIVYNSFYAWDARSKQYTDANAGAGANGIKRFTISLKDGSNVIGSNSFSAAGTGSVTFNHLSSNKNYTVSVKATDMAGNSSNKIIGQVSSTFQVLIDLKRTRLTSFNYTTKIQVYLINS